MKAIVYEKSGSSRLTLREVEKPTPAADEVLIKVRAVALNAADYRSMRMGVIPKRKIFGADVAGVVEAAGSQVTLFKAGDEVFGDLSFSGSGGLAEYVTAPQRLLARKPENVSWVQAAAVPMSALTALQALRDKGHVQPDQRVLIVGAGGGVGSFAVQLAKHFGAQVTAVCGPKNAEKVRALGADRVMDYTESDFTQTPERYDLILAVNGGHPLLTYRRLLAKRGTCVVVGGALAQVIKVMLFGWLLSLGSKRMSVLSAKASPEDLEFVINLVAQGKIQPVIDRTCPLEETPQAFDYLSRGHALGKVVVTVVDG
jgi:NADPH:quinone reductase-like Zn-dependent oxidoreductase